MLPVVTVIGLQVGTLLAGAILTETIFSWPGLGRWLIDRTATPRLSGSAGRVLLVATMTILVMAGRSAVRRGEPAYSS
ncbi:ABC transporter permease subunit [Escherichia coli]